MITCGKCGARNRVRPERLDAAVRCGSCKSAIGPLERPHAVADAAELDAVVAGSPLPVLVDFWAAWCGPCRAVAPELERLASERRGRLVVLKVDTEALPALSARHQVQGIPCFVLFRDGREAARATGAMPADALARALGL